MRRRATLAIWAAALLALAAPLATAPALAATPRTSLTEIEGEVMCPVCGTLLELAESPQSQRERAFIARLLREGKTKAQVKQALLAQYGSAVLAVPRGSGFDLSAYLVPVIGFLIAAAALAVGLRRWRRATRAASSPPAATAPPQGEDAERLEADLARYDL